MSKILLINGSPNKNGSTNLALSEIAKEFENIQKFIVGKF